MSENFVWILCFFGVRKYFSQPKKKNMYDYYSVYFCLSRMQPLFVASCSTLPKRIENQQFKETVFKLANNPRIEAVYIQYPKKCTRLDMEYPPVPDWMKSHDKIKVNTDAEDWGPATKVISMCEILPVDSTHGVILFDDDRIYTDVWIENLMNGFDHHDGHAAVAYQGTLRKDIPFQYNKYNMPSTVKQHNKEQHQRFSIVKTAGLVIYPRRALPNRNQDFIKLIEKYRNKRSLFNDDMILAGLCYKNLVPIFILPIEKHQHKHWLDVNNDKDNDTWSLSALPNHVKPQIVLARAMATNGDLGVPWTELTTVIISAVILIVLIAICVLVGKMFVKQQQKKK